MDMSTFTNKEDHRLTRLRRHVLGLRNNQESVALIVLTLLGYEVELHYTGKPNASAAKEMLDELDWDDSIAIWSQSTTAGGFWETWQRDAMKYGELTGSYDTWKARTNK